MLNSEVRKNSYYITLISVKNGHRFDPFLLGPSQKRMGILDSFLNVLLFPVFLFIPFGFGLSSQLRQCKWSWASVLIFALIGTALCSYTVEILEF